MLTLLMSMLVSLTATAQASAPQAPSYLVFQPPTSRHLGVAAPISRVEVSGSTLLIWLEGQRESAPFEVPHLLPSRARDDRDAILNGTSLNVSLCVDWEFEATGRPVHGCASGIRTARFSCVNTGVVPFYSDFRAERFVIRNPLEDPITVRGIECD